MLLLESGTFREELAAALSTAEQEIVVLSAFIKVEALEWLMETSSTDKLKIVARWQPADLASGVSDLNCFHLCNEAGIPFGISNQLHGKVYVVDDQIFIGSANLTSKGMSLSKTQNDEFGTGFEYGKAERTKVENYLSSVNWLDIETVELMSRFLAGVDKPAISNSFQWPQDISDRLNPQHFGLWYHDLPLCSADQLISRTASENAIRHDLLCFGKEQDAVQAELLQGFLSSPICHWIDDQLQEFGELSFGKVTALFHSQLLDDPVPYRQEIKIGIANLFDWASLAECRFKISQPRYSQIISAA